MDVVLAFGSSLLITAMAYRYAIIKGLMDVPNTRSSHTQPTPRGGGISFVLTYCVYLILCYLKNVVGRNMVVALVIGGLMVAIVGWVDDHRGLSAALRLCVHLLAAVWVVLWGQPVRLDLGFLSIQSSWMVYCLGVLLVTWFTNLYNFMDGIDGLASVEAISCGIAVWALTRRSGESVVASLGLILAASVLGFLPLNWSPAKIFMGDVGSGYLGFTIGSLAVISPSINGPPTWVWVVLSGVFVVDATLTLIRRILQGDRWHEAHRSHVYQLAVQAGHSHRRVTSSVLAINACLFSIILLAQDRLSSTVLTLLPLAALMQAHVLLYFRWRKNTGDSQVPTRGVRNSLG
jgi:Fuc2NAc and GlcNAc transferase